jgi:hypothetical protein
MVPVGPSNPLVRMLHSKARATAGQLVANACSMSRTWREKFLMDSTALNAQAQAESSRARIIKA